MKKFSLLSFAGFCAAFGVQAQEVGRVISSVPVIQQLAVPRQVCSNQPVAVQQPNSGAGSLMGAIAGGAMGNAIGGGGGRAAATVLGLVGGAVLGNSIEGSGAQMQNFQQCSTQTFYENRAVAYNVTYEYAGKQYTVQMPNDPGPTVRLQVTPIGASSADPAQYDSAASQGVPILSSAAYPYPQAAFVQPEVMQPVLVAPATAVDAPYAPYSPYVPYYYRPYYPPLGLSLNFGYSRGGHRHREHGNWR